MARKSISLSVKLAATLLMLTDADGSPLIPHEHAKLMSADQIISLFQFDHYPIRHEAGGPDEPWNLVPRMIVPHRIKTAKIDIPEAAKIKRIVPAEEEFRRRMLAKGSPEPDADLAPRVPKLKGRGFSKEHRPLRSRNSFRRKNGQ